MTYESNHELYHYGVPGMKWGVIRDRFKQIGTAAKAGAFIVKSYKDQNGSESNQPNEKKGFVRETADELKDSIKDEFVNRIFDEYAPKTLSWLGSKGASVCKRGAQALSKILRFRR